MAIRVSKQSQGHGKYNRRGRRHKMKGILSDVDDDNGNTFHNKHELFGGSNDFSVEAVLVPRTSGSNRTVRPARTSWFFSSSSKRKVNPDDSSINLRMQWGYKHELEVTDETVRFKGYGDSTDFSFELRNLKSVRITTVDGREDCLEMKVEDSKFPFIFRPSEEGRTQHIKLVLLKGAKAAENIQKYRRALNKLRDAVVEDFPTAAAPEKTNALGAITEEEETPAATTQKLETVTTTDEIIQEALLVLRNTRIDMGKRVEWAAGGVLQLFMKMLHSEHFQPYLSQIYGGICSFTSRSRSIRQQFADEGVVHVVLEHLRSNIYDEAIHALAGLSQLADVATLMGERGAIGLLLRLLPTMSKAARDSAFTTLQNMANQQENQALFMYSGGIEHILNYFQNGSGEGVAAPAGTILLLLSENDLLKQSLLDHGVYEMLQKLLKSQNLYSKGLILDARLALANLAAYHLNEGQINVKQNVDIPTYENAQQIVNACELTLDGLAVDDNVYQLSSLVTGIANLALIERYKELLMQAGAGMVCIRALRRGLEDADDKLVTMSVHGIWQLAFHPKNKDLLINLGCLSILDGVQKSLAGSPEKANLLSLVESVLFTLGRETSSTDTKVDKEEEKTRKKPQHTCMISYSWAQQSTAKRLFNDLVAAGHNPWIDVNEMKGSILHSMAEAIESVPVVILLASREYFLSANCRLEAEYSMQLKKQIIPVLTQEDFKPSSWLGLIFGSKLYYTLTPDTYADQSQQLVQAVTGVSDVNQMALPLALTEEDAISNLSKVSSWKKEQVEDWLDSIDLSEHKADFAKHSMTGRSLIGLHGAIEKGRDEFVETMLRTEFKMPFGSIMAIKTALHSLLGSQY